MLSIRPFVPADYPAYTRLRHAAIGEGRPPFTEAVYRERDANRSAETGVARFMADRGGVTVGFAEYGEPVSHRAPGRWFVDLAVAPEARGEGVGRALAQHLEQALATREVRALWAGALEGGPGVAFATRRGFGLVQREAFSRLALDAFDPAPFERLTARLAAEGIAIVPAIEVLASDPEAKRRWWDIDWAAEQDIPAAGEATRVPFEMFLKYFEAPWFDPNAWFVAREGLEWVGITGLTPTAKPALWHTAITAVIRSHRRRGIASALKARAVQFARANGGRYIRTENEEDNPMLAINLRFGFEERGAWLHLERRFGEEVQGDAGE